MKLEQLYSELFLIHKESTLQHRYITNNHIEPLLKSLPEFFEVSLVGNSVNKLPIYSVKVGHGKKKIFMWSQMHGNESTTTKVVFDLFNCISQGQLDQLLESCQFCIIPILNPDGALVYTRHNGNNIDLNRDAQLQTQPETRILFEVFKEFQPDFCFNLHGQRTIFSAGEVAIPATVSFLAPAQDKDCTITDTRRVAMGIIIAMNDVLQKIIPNQIGIYDDAFNMNCVGDTFQSYNIPTVLFEAGHFSRDYSREEVRKFVFIALMTAINEIAQKPNKRGDADVYLNIPQNKKLFYDIIIRNVKRSLNGDSCDIAIQYHEVLETDTIDFQPKIEKIEKALKFYAHEEINGNGLLVQGVKKEQLKEGNEIDFVYINDEKYSLKLDKS